MCFWFLSVDSDAIPGSSTSHDSNLNSEKNTPVLDATGTSNFDKSFEEEITNTAQPKRNRQYRQLGELARKRQVKKDEWETIVSQQQVNRGIGHTTKKGNIIQKNTIKEDCSPCRFKCYEKLSIADREEINKNFWNIGDHNLQSNFIHGCIITSNNNSDETEDTSTRCSRKYFFLVNDEKLFVCKTMFLNTMHISDKWLRTIF